MIWRNYVTVTRHVEPKNWIITFDCTFGRCCRSWSYLCFTVSSGVFARNVSVRNKVAEVEYIQSRNIYTLNIHLFTIVVGYTGMVICPERRANDLHIVQLMPLPSHPLLLQTPVKSRMVYLSGTGLPRSRLSTCPGKRPLNGCSVVVVITTAWRPHHSSLINVIVFVTTSCASSSQLHRNHHDNPLSWRSLITLMIAPPCSLSLAHWLHARVTPALGTISLLQCLTSKTPESLFYSYRTATMLCSVFMKWTTQNGTT